MKWSSAISVRRRLPEAAEEASAAVRDGLEGTRPDLLVAFVSAHHADAYGDLPGILSEALSPVVLVGCSAGGVIGAGREVENEPGLSLTAAVLPGVELKPFRVADGALPGLDESPRAWHVALGVPPAEDLHFLVLPEPFSSDAERFLEGLDFAYPSSIKIGGMASGGQSPGRNVLFLDGAVYKGGLVGVAMRGALRVEAIVAQGCRPVGEPMTITRCDRNVLFEVDGRAPLVALREVYRDLTPRDRELFHHSLFLGVVMDESRERYGQGDFLVRNILGADPESGALAVGAILKDRQHVQFHLRDAETSADDLSTLLMRHAQESPDPPAGALLFSCLGRGMHLYGRRDHDTGLFQKIVGNVPLGGFFCNGEIGPVGGTTWIHGYTSAFGLFRAAP